MKYVSIAVAIALFMVPMALAQDLPIEQPIVPPDIADAITGVGSGPVISIIFDILDTGIALIVDLIDTIVAIIVALIVDLIDTIVAIFFDIIDTIVATIGSVFWAKGGVGWLFSIIMAWFWVLQSLFPMFTWIKGSWHFFSGGMRYIPGLACIPNFWNAIKVTLQICAI